MLTITARLFKDNQLVGYRLSDEQREQDFTKQQAWIYAKNKQILNVVATGTQDDPGLSGTNGFELKKLPEIKWQDTSKKKYTKEEVDAAVLRDTINRGYFGYDLHTGRTYESFSREAFRNDTDAGILNYANSKIFSESILIENKLYDAMEPIARHKDTGELLLSRSNILGYKIKNIGEQPIPITRITVKSDHVTSETVLNPSESLCLNRAELALLASKPEVGCTFINGILYVHGKYEEAWYDVLKNCYIRSDSDFGEPIDIRMVEAPEIVDKYFCPTVQVLQPGQRFNSKTLAAAIASGQINKDTRFTVSNKPQKKPSLFNMFKR